jgi:hypothetical protein
MAVLLIVNRERTTPWGGELSYKVISTFPACSGRVNPSYGGGTAWNHPPGSAGTLTHLGGDHRGSPVMRIAQTVRVMVQSFLVSE